MQITDGATGTVARLQARAAQRSDGSGALLAEFIGRYAADASPNDLAGRTDDDVYGAIVEHWQIGRQRAAGETLVRVLSPDVSADGWQSPHSVMFLVTDDAPFLVDSVRMALDRVGLGIHLMIHPMLRVARDDDGVIVDLPDRGGMDEAWTQMEIDRCSAAEARAAETAIAEAVADVHRAVADVEAMRAFTLDLAKGIETDPPPGVDPGAAQAAQKLLGWLARRHFVFLGAASYDRVPGDGAQGDGDWRVREGSQLGLLRRDATMDPPPADHREALSVARSERRSTVHRDARLTSVAVRSFDRNGLPVAEHRVVGLFSAAAYRESVLAIPYVRDRAEAVLDESDAPAESHVGRSLRTVLETFPRDEMFEITTPRLAEIVHGIVGLQERQIVRVFAVAEPAGPWATVLVYLPRSRFTAETVGAVAQRVVAAFDADAHETDASLGTSALARIMVRVRRGSPLFMPDLDALGAEIDEITTPWADRLRRELINRFGEEQGISHFEHIGVAFPSPYRALVDPRAAVADLEHVAALVDSGDDLATAMSRSIDAPVDEWRFRIYRRGGQATLDELLPLLDQLGMRALDERPFELHVGGDTVWLYDIGVRLPDAVVLDDATSAELQRTFADLYSGRVECDGFNRMVLTAGMTGRQVAVLRAYGRYLRQIAFPFSQQYIEATLVKHRKIAAALASMFDTRFDPVFDGDRAEACAAIEATVLAALDRVPSLDEDRIVRAFLALVAATTRTNAFRPAAEGDRPRVLAMKLDPARVPDLPLPRPQFEIWVSSPQVEGVHLRGGRIARGGIRWSDRREDFRTEVLGLMKAQMVKNAVIVPVGAKGGFVVKRPPADPEGLRSEVVACYRAFIGGLLDVTDNIVGADVVPPPSTVRYDGDDPYLVVAADKGTATFSDIANEIAAEYGFWLGDAFASGGSAGYDHKAMGITARGAWESVRRHARALGLDADADRLTVVGIGDMSGDVFGNGLLRSPHVQLVAAFDHRHVFIDPDPDPQVSFEERRRLFMLPRSSWADYDSSLLSPGGGVYPRTAKSITLSAQARERLGIEAETMTPNEVISAVLRAPVDLLWNGGIGTYVKASTETHAEVGDRANDGVRVDGAALRCRMVGEGGNLGFTQRGRVEYALGGGLINTDAIDNSAGVDCSDHEVNIKILLGAAVANGDLTIKQRNELLVEMTDTVAEHVLADNVAQTLALGIARRQAHPMVNVHTRYLAVLEADGHIDRALEFLPTDKQLAERQASGQGLTTPEFAVLLAYTKMGSIAEVLASDLPDDPDLDTELVEYFPALLRDRFRDQIHAHRLRREIVATRIVNKMVNLSGISFDHRMTEETGSSTVDIVRAWVAACRIFGVDELWHQIDGLRSDVKPEVQIDLFLDARRMQERSALWLLRHRRPPIDISDAVDEFRDGVRSVSSAFDDVVSGRMADVVHSSEAARLAAGVPERLAQQSAVWPLMHTTFDVVELSAARAFPVLDAARTYWELFEALDIGWLWDGIGALPRSDRWQTQARSALRDDLLAALADLTGDAIDAGRGVGGWIAANERSVGRLAAMFDDIRRAQVLDLTTLSVALRQLRNLALTAQRIP